MMSKLLKTLVSEHERILAVIAALHDFAALHAQDEPDARMTLGKFVQFLREYTDGWHHIKEEDLLFTTMIRAGFPKDHGPVACMLKEHELGRAHVAALAGLARGAGPLTARELAELAEHVMGYARLLVAHIAKENQMLYPMAERNLPGEILDALDEAADAFTAREGARTGRDLETLGETLVARYRAARVDTAPLAHA
jgi:hemerythrin-like domain-containing protein